MDPLDYVEGLARGTVMENDPCSFCGIRAKINSDIIPKLEYFAKWSPVAMARYVDIAHDMSHYQHIYFDRECNYVGDIALPHRNVWFPGIIWEDSDLEEQWGKHGLTNEDWARVVRVIKLISSYCVPLNKVILGIWNEFNGDKDWNGKENVLTFISTLGQFGLLISCSSGYHDDELVSRKEGSLEINFNQAIKLIYKEEIDDSQILQEFKKSKELQRTISRKFTLEWLIEHGYLSR